MLITIHRDTPVIVVVFVMVVIIAMAISVQSFQVYVVMHIIPDCMAGFLIVTVVTVTDTVVIKSTIPLKSSVFSFLIPKVRGFHWGNRKSGL